MRLITRSDFDGLVCAVFLTEKGVVDEFLFVHPKDVQDGKVKVDANDVLANVPYAPGCGLWFDHHATEEDRLEPGTTFEGAYRRAPSAAQIVWDYYGGQTAFGRFASLLEAVNKTDSGQLTPAEILEPKGWILLSFMMDPRTGLGRFSDFRISNYQLMMALIGYCRTMDVDEILRTPDVKERVDRYTEQHRLHKQMLLKHSTTIDNVVVTDLRPCETLFAGNRFMIFALRGAQNVELRILPGKRGRNTMFACGHSILDRTCKTDVGQLMAKYGGGGHPKVGTCQVPIEDADRVRDELVEALRSGD